MPKTDTGNRRAYDPEAAPASRDRSAQSYDVIRRAADFGKGEGVPDLQSLFEPEKTLEVVIRGTVVYFAIFIILRAIAKQLSGGINLADLLLLVLVADAAQNALAGEYNSITDGLVLVSTLAFWSYFIDWLGYKWPAAGRLLHPAPVELVKDGKELVRNMRRELITHEELMTHVRQAGAQELGQVKRAWMEGNGGISVIVTESENRQDGSGPGVPGLT